LIKMSPADRTLSVAPAAGGSLFNSISMIVVPLGASNRSHANYRWSFAKKRSVAR
jgi:hypothetical protein